jgi:hypothetical protein
MMDNCRVGASALAQSLLLLLLLLLWLLDRAGKVTDEVYGQEVMFMANDWHAALLPLLLTARFR